MKQESFPLLWIILVCALILGGCVGIDEDPNISDALTTDSDNKIRTEEKQIIQQSDDDIKNNTNSN
jgi:hypothetical protein